MHHLDRQKHVDPLSWSMAYAGKAPPGKSAEEATRDIGDMLKFRKKDATVFFVIDEVSQYSQFNKDRTDKLRAFATALGSTFGGKAWMLALGSKNWTRERMTLCSFGHVTASHLLCEFTLPPQIFGTSYTVACFKRKATYRDAQGGVQQASAELQLYAYGCSEVTADEFIEIYPMLPGQIDLVLQITSALRTRSTRAQGDDQAIRGLCSYSVTSSAT